MRRSKIGYSIDGCPEYFGWKPLMGCTAGCPTCWACRQVKRYPCKKCRTCTPHVHWERLEEPEKRKKPALILCNFEGDWMDPGFRPWHSAGVQQRMEELPRHTFITLTQKSSRLRHLLKDRQPFEHIYHGLTIRTQAEATERIPIFLEVPGKLWLSIEPIWGPMMIRQYLVTGKIQGVIVGQDSTKGYRETECDSAIRVIRTQCKETDVPCFVKQVWKHFPPPTPTASEWHKSAVLLKASKPSLFEHYPAIFHSNNRLPWGRYASRSQVCYMT